jgi:hypothetical protein
MLRSFGDMELEEILDIQLVLYEAMLRHELIKKDR